MNRVVEGIKKYAYGNYVPSIMPNRYNAFIHINHSNALHPLKVSKVVL